jgi:A/G-specific adenine glycosylase
MTLAARKRTQKNAAKKAVKKNGHGAPDPAVLLAWYDRHRRRLPWRALPGRKADPYRVWLSEIMLQQNTVKAVAPYYERFLTRWPTAKDLAAAKLDDVLKLWAGLGYYARARNLHACARAVAQQHGGTFPADEKALLALPGIGTYTAAAIISIAFGQKATPIDGNIERVIARLFAVEDALPAAKPQIRAHAESLTPEQRAGDFAQAMMDLGATLCTPKRPACSLCPWTASCAVRQRGDQETFPRKIPKVEGKLRRGAAFVALRADGAILVRTRPEKGLLGGMTEVPTTPWTNDFQLREAMPTAPFPAQWKKLPGVVTHVFTHFPLELSVYCATLPKRTRAPKGARWTPVAEVHGEALPNVMRKVIAHALER